MATKMLRTMKRIPSIDDTGTKVGEMEIATRTTAAMRTRRTTRAKKMTNTRTRAKRKRKTKKRRTKTKTKTGTTRPAA